jgi:hypothetical protein
MHPLLFSPDDLQLHFPCEILELAPVLNGVLAVPSLSRAVNAAPTPVPTAVTFHQRPGQFALLARSLSPVFVL